MVQSFNNTAAINSTSVITKYTTTYYNGTIKSLSKYATIDDNQTLSDTIFSYTLKKPYLYISITVLSMIAICVIMYCIMCIRRNSMRSRQASDGKQFQLTWTLTGNSLGGHSKKHSLKIMPALTPDNNNKELEEIEEIDCTQQSNIDKEEDETQNIKSMGTMGTMGTVNTLGLSEYEFENEWYEPTLSQDNLSKDIMGSPKEIKLQHLQVIEDDVGNKDDKKRKYQKANSDSEWRWIDTKTDDKKGEENKDENDDEYKWIINTLKKLEKKNGNKIITVFKENRVTDKRLKDLSQSDWKELVPQIGIRNELKKLYENKFGPWPSEGF